MALKRVIIALVMSTLIAEPNIKLIIMSARQAETKVEILSIISIIIKVVFVAHMQENFDPCL